MEATSGEPMSSRNEIYKIENLSPITPMLDTEDYPSGPSSCFELSFMSSTQGIVPIDQCVVVLQEYENCDIQFPYLGLYCMRHVYMSVRESLSADNQNLVPMTWFPLNFQQTLHLESTQCQIVSSPVRVPRTPSDFPPSEVIMSIREFIISSGALSREDGSPIRRPGTPPGSPPSKTNNLITSITSPSQLCEEPLLDSSEWSGSGRIWTHALNNSDAEPSESSQGEYRQPYEPFVRSEAKIIPYQSGPRYPLRYRSIFHTRVNVEGLEYSATPLTGRTCNQLNYIRKRIDFDMEEH
ncbi:unnamed protein product [Hermetia illucens]|uniref:Uncharacterized protein n=1 Tax=Hermetia illucens TaxID=343691 RepID=A0A7R8UUI6_HERIL|nr:unnamed protein product [Hermetia illucens]